MKIVMFVVCWALFAYGLQEQQAPKPQPSAQISGSPAQAVPLSEEVHHQLLLQNKFTRVYSLSVQPNDATVLHRHDAPFLNVNFGPTEITDTRTGKTPEHLKLADGEVRYSPGGITHVLATSASNALNGVTIELLLPQSNPRNICKAVIAGATGNCPSKNRAPKSAQEADEIATPDFQTDEMRVEEAEVWQGHDFLDAAAKEDALLVALTDANLDADLGGKHLTFLHVGDVVWLPAGQHRKVGDFLGTHSRFLLITFRQSN